MKETQQAIALLMKHICLTGYINRFGRKGADSATIIKYF